MKPDHPEEELAVSLLYEGSGAPRVTAKGEGETARRILELAEEYDVPIYQDKQLTQLLSQVDLDREIPASLYLAVAEIIAFAYALKDKVPQPPPEKRTGRTIEHQPSEWDEWL